MNITYINLSLQGNHQIILLYWEDHVHVSTPRVATDIWFLLQISNKVQHCIIVGYIVDGRKSTSERDLPVCGFMANLVERFLLGAFSNGSVESIFKCVLFIFEIFLQEKVLTIFVYSTSFQSKDINIMILIILLYG